jgi:YD repeat-containing protein
LARHLAAAAPARAVWEGVFLVALHCAAIVLRHYQGSSVLVSRRNNVMRSCIAWKTAGALAMMLLPHSHAVAGLWASLGHQYGCQCGGAVLDIYGGSKESVCQQAAEHASSCKCFPPQHPGSPSVFTVAGYSYTPGDTEGSCRIEDPLAPGSTYDLIPYKNVLVETSPAIPSPNTCSVPRPRFGNPIEPLTGAKTEHLRTGFTIGGIELALLYDTARKLPANQADTETLLYERQSFGALWRSNLHRRLSIATGRKAALLSRGDGAVISFSGNGSGGFTATPGHAHKLATITGGYRFTDSTTGELDTFDVSGKLLAIAFANGTTLTFSYSGGLLTRVVANDGRMLRFSYGSNGLVSQVVGPDSRAIDAAYDASNNLTALTWNDAKTLGFVYENAALPWAMTGKIDENGSRFATFVYDGEGRAISTEYAGGVNRFSVSYGTAPSQIITDSFDAVAKVLYRARSWNTPAGTSVTQPNGQALALDAQVVAGWPVLAAATQPAGSGCAASTSAMSYDSNGNVLSRDDFQGARTCYAYDANNRETARVEGLAATTACAGVLAAGASLPAGARKITTSWHPDWALAAQVVQPLRRTSTVHHGQPDPFNGNVVASCSPAAARVDGKPLALVCKEVEQALLASGAVDSAAATRIISHTYDAAGRVLSSIDPRGHTTTYAYYATTMFSGSHDPHLANVSLLLHGSGANGSVAVTDSSPLRQAVGVVGNAKISSAQSKFGGTAIAFDGSGDYLRIPYSADLAFGAGDFTIEAFVYKNANNANYSRIWNADGDYYEGLTASIDPSGNFAVYVTTTGTGWTHSLPVVANLANGQWHHLAVVRSGGSIYAFVNGVRSVVTTALGSTPLYSNTGVGRVIGGQSGADRALNGYIDEFRITKGVARYTANFTPPAQEAQDAGPGMAETGHTAGDLQSVTNAMGHVTTFNAYDPAGRVRQMTDAKGVVTDVTYTPRGRVSTVTTTPPGGAARTTTYTYDSVGQLTQVSQPDGTSLSYSYDAAHRLTGVTDARGNAVTYTLDNAGNRIAEEVRDPTGTLQRSVVRSFDALNRLQQAVGATR